MDAENYTLSNVFNGVLIGLLTLFLSLSSDSVWAGQCTERKWREDYPREKESGLICENPAAPTIFYIFSDDKGCAFELYYRNGRILAQSYVVTRYIEHLDFSGLRLDRKSLQLQDRREIKANCRVATAQAIINEYSKNVDAQLSNNRF